MTLKFIQKKYMTPEEKFSEAINFKRTGEFKKAIEVYLTLLKEFPFELEIYSALGKVYYLDKQYEKAMVNYMVSFHLRAMSNFPNYALPMEEFKTAIVEDCFNITYHAGSANLILSLNQWKPKLAEYFDVEKYLNNYTNGLMGNSSEGDELYRNFTNNLGGAFFINFINWEMLIIKNQNDLKTIIDEYEYICQSKEVFAAGA